MLRWLGLRTRRDGWVVLLALGMFASIHVPAGLVFEHASLAVVKWAQPEPIPKPDPSPMFAYPPPPDLYKVSDTLTQRENHAPIKGRITISDDFPSFCTGETLFYDADEDKLFVCATSEAGWVTVEAVTITITTFDESGTLTYTEEE